MDERERVTPARPHHKLTADGRRMREVLSYSRRGNRFTPNQAAAWGAHHEQWVIPDAAVDSPDFSLADWFGREAPLIVEIGSGVGEATAALAAGRPAYDVLAFEVWRPGVADTLWRLAEAGAGNVRLIGVDAVWSLEHLRRRGWAGGAVDVLPRPLAQDPAPQASAGRPGVRAARGRPAGARRDLAAGDRLGRLRRRRCAPCSTPSRGSTADRCRAGTERPVTRFERKGLEAGRTITDLAYRQGLHSGGVGQPDAAPGELLLDPLPLGVELRAGREHAEQVA